MYWHENILARTSFIYVQATWRVWNQDDREYNVKILERIILPIKKKMQEMGDKGRSQK